MNRKLLSPPVGTPLLAHSKLNDPDHRKHEQDEHRAVGNGDTEIRNFNPSDDIGLFRSAIPQLNGDAQGDIHEHTLLPARDGARRLPLLR
jgi:hypothetical protein